MLVPVTVPFLSGILCRVLAQTLRETVTTAKLAAAVSEAMS
jgi:hypothetical protein